VKRYRHYTKDKVILLSCFGSVVEQSIYEKLLRETEKRFEGIDVFLSFSSKMVLKDLKRKGLNYPNLPQRLADLDYLGYRNIIVASINLFPTDEHELLIRTVKGFKEFSYSNIRYTKAIINRTRETTIFLKELNSRVTKKDIANLYIVHGVPLLDLAGVLSVNYTKELLELLGERNYLCSLEGSLPFYAVKESLIDRMRKANIKKIQIIPMLLVSGNHYIKDILDIKEELGRFFETSVVESLSESKRFNLLELDGIRDIIFSNIEEEIIKLG
jgi:sirohydrochlorin cobaltochelatase